jgi:hypothetical protein
MTSGIHIGQTQESARICVYSLALYSSIHLAHKAI